MPAFQPRLLPLATLVLAFAATLSGVEVSLDSPFLPAAGAAAAQSRGGALEFRGMLVAGGETYFNLADTSAKRSAWVKLNESGRDFVVRNYQVVNRVDTVTVEYQGRSLSLSLVAAKTGKAAPVSMVAPGPVPVPGQPQPTAVLNPTPADESRRLEEFRAEIARRRAQRAQQAQPQAGQPQPQQQTR